MNVQMQGQTLLGQLDIEEVLFKARYKDGLRTLERSRLSAEKRAEASADLEEWHEEVREEFKFIREMIGKVLS